MSTNYSAKVENFLTDLSSSEAYIRKTAAEELGKLGYIDHRVATALKMTAATDPNKYVREAAQASIEALLTHDNHGDLRESAITCSNCGTKNRASAKFCGACGTQLHVVQEISSSAKACWFCDSLSATTSSALEVKLFGNVVYTPTQGGRTRIQWQKATILVSRCAKCKAAHETPENWKMLGYVVGAVIGISALAILLIPLFSSGYRGAAPLRVNIWGVILILALAIAGPAFVVGKIAEALGNARLPKGIQPQANYKTFPAVEQLKSQGWEIGEKPSGVR